MSLLSADIPNTLKKLDDDNVAVAVLYNPDGHNRFIVINDWHFLKNSFDFRSLYSEIDLPLNLCVQVLYS